MFVLLDHDMLVNNAELQLNTLFFSEGVHLFLTYFQCSGY